MRKQYKWIRSLNLIIACALLLGSLGFLSRSVAAKAPARFFQQEASPQGECFSLDVVFLIDQSSSMSGYAGTPASDPGKQRKYAVEAAIDQLADIALDRCPDTQHRLAVISYGTDVRVDMEWSNIAPDTFKDAEYIRGLLKPKVKADDLGQTDPKRAFEKAKELFDDLPAPQPGEIRKKVIIFITDGIPYVDTGVGVLKYASDMQDQTTTDFPFSQALLGLEQCIDGLRSQYGTIENAPGKQVNDCIKQNPVSDKDYQNSTYIWMILLKSFQVYPGGLLDVYNTIAQKHAGKMIELSQNRNEIPTTFRTILSDLAGAKASLLQCGKFAVNPYLKRATLNIFKLNKDLQVTLAYTSADGEYHEISGGVESGSGGAFNVKEYYAFGANERYVFTSPYPGLWDLRADDCTGLDAFYEEVKINVGHQEQVMQEWPQYDRPPYYDAEKPFYMKIQMLDEAGQVVRQADHPQFAVNVVMTVTQPDGVEKRYEMEWVPEDNIFRAKEPLEVPVPGVYRIDIVGTTHKHEGEPAPLSSDSYSDVFSSEYELFRLDGVEFSVFPVTPFQVKIISPTDSADIGPVHSTLFQNGWTWPLKINPIPVRAQILDEQGNPLSVDLQEIFPNPENILTAKVVSQAGDSAVITLQPDSNNPGIYQGEFLGFEGVGRQTLFVQLEGDYSDHYRPLTREDKIEIYRTEPLWHRERFYVTIFYSLLILLVLSLILWLNGRRNPLQGTLVFFIGTDERARFSISTARQMRRRNRKVIGRKRLKPYPDLGLRKIEVRWQRQAAISRQRSNRKEDQASDGVVDDYFNAQSETFAHRGVTMKCWPFPKGRPYTVDLQPDMLIPYDKEENIRRVKYEP